MFDKILVAVDISGNAFEVVAQAAELASRLGAEAALLYCPHLPPGVHPGDTVHTPSHPEGRAALDTLDEDAAGHLRPLLAIFDDAGVSCQMLVRHGSPAETVLKTSAEVAADMIVVGTHGRTGVGRLLWGSVAEQIVRSARVPVLVIRSLAAEEETSPSEVARQLAVEAEG